MKAFSLTLFAALWSFSATVQATALGDLVLTMGPGTWKKVTAAGLDYSLVDAGSNHHILEYSESCVWDPKSEQVLFVGQGHYANLKFIAYGAAANSWRQLPQPSWWCGTPGSCIGHAYDHNALDPATGNHYFTRYGGTSVHRYNATTDQWSSIPDIPSNLIGQNACCKAMAYYPEMNGLIHVAGGTVAIYRPATGQWTSVASGLAMGGYQNFAEYSPGLKVVFFGCGSGDPRKLYRLDASGNTKRLADPPCDLDVANSEATVDPVSGALLVVSDDKKLYGYDAAGDKWNLLFPFLPFRTFGTIATPISTYHVTMFLTTDYNSAPQMYIYKHSGGTGGETQVEAQVKEEITVTPNPFKSSARITAPGAGPQAFRLYFPDGRMLKAFLPGPGPSWTLDAKDLPPGLYFLKGGRAGKVYSTKLIVTQ